MGAGVENGAKPAFPSLEELEVWDDDRGKYVPNGYGFRGGLTKREKIAAMAMEGLVRGAMAENEAAAQDTARRALRYADALLVELEKEK